VSTSSELALERRFPTLRGRLPRRPLATLPTPVHRLAGLERATGLGDLWIKRDDRTGTLYGGNKVRKLEWLLADALARGHRTVVTTGALGSNHALATTIYAGTLGLRVRLVLIPQPVTPAVRRTLLLDHAHGAAIHFAPTVGAARRIVIGLLAGGFMRGDRPYLVPTGGSSVLGTLGYVNAGLELAEQIAAGEAPEPAAVVVPLGTGGTAVGLAVGLKLAGLRTRVIAVRVTDLFPPSPASLSRLARRALAVLHRLGADVATTPFTPDDLDVRADWLGPGYGAPTPEAEDARRSIEASEGLRFELTYGAKALAGALACARDPAWRDRPLLFWHTYSGVDPGLAFTELPDWRALPAPLHRFFASDA
jgi:D-cysteine desulfhydrase